MDEWWAVLRTDDLGNTFLAAHGLKESVAKTVLEKFSARAHKQTYFIDKYPPAGLRDLLVKYNVKR